MKDTAKFRKELLEIMQTNQGRISKSCEQIGICRDTYYIMRKRHPTWAKKVDEIEHKLIEAVKVKGIQIALEGSPSMIQFILKNKLQNEFNATERVELTEVVIEPPKRTNGD